MADYVIVSEERSGLSNQYSLICRNDPATDVPRAYSTPFSVAVVATGSGTKAYIADMDGNWQPA